MGKIIIEAKDLVKTYQNGKNRLVVLDNINIQIREESIISIVWNINPAIVFNKLNIIGATKAIKLDKLSMMMICTLPRRIRIFAVFEE